MQVGGIASLLRWASPKQVSDSRVLPSSTPLWWFHNFLTMMCSSYSDESVGPLIIYVRPLFERGMVFATIAAFKLGVSPNLAAYETKTPQREGGSRRGVQMTMRR